MIERIKKFFKTVWYYIDSFIEGIIETYGDENDKK